MNSNEINIFKNFNFFLYFDSHTFSIFDSNLRTNNSKYNDKCSINHFKKMCDIKGVIIFIV